MQFGRRAGCGGGGSEPVVCGCAAEYNRGRQGREEEGDKIEPSTDND